MTKELTYNILKYGYMDPQKAKNVISEYFDIIELEKNSYWSGWEKVDDMFLSYTHFITLITKNIDGQVFIGISVRDIEDFVDLQNKFITTGGEVLLNVTNLSPDHTMDLFNECYTDIVSMCSNNEYERNYPDGSYEQ
jgi:F0F1-type ATP synthase gamma subunit